MPATPFKMKVSEQELEEARAVPRGAGFGALPVPIDVILEVVDVTDHTARDSGNKGLKWSLVIRDVDPTADLGGIDPSLFNGLSFDYYTMFSAGSRRRLLRHLNATGADTSSGVMAVDPNEAIGSLVGGRVDYPREYYETPVALRVDSGPWYKELRYTFPLADRPELEVGRVERHPDEPAEEAGYLAVVDVTVEDELEDVETI